MQLLKKLIQNSQHYIQLINLTKAKLIGVSYNDLLCHTNLSRVVPHLSIQQPCLSLIPYSFYPSHFGLPFAFFAPSIQLFSQFYYIHRPPWHMSKASQTIPHHIQTILGLHPKIIFLCFLTLDKSISFITLKPYYHGNQLGPLILNRWTSNQIRTGSDIIGFLVTLKSNYKASKFIGKVNQITKLKCYIFFSQVNLPLVRYCLSILHK